MNDSCITFWFKFKTQKPEADAESEQQVKVFIVKHLLVFVEVAE